MYCQHLSIYYVWFDRHRVQEFAIRGRMGLKELQLQALMDVKDQGNLSDPQVRIYYLLIKFNAKLFIQTNIIHSGLFIPDEIYLIF